MAARKSRYMVALDVNRYNPDDPTFDSLIEAINRAVELSEENIRTTPARVKWFVICVLYSEYGEPFEPVAAVVQGRVMIWQELIDVEQNARED